MTALSTLVVVESKLFLRERIFVIMVLALPVVLTLAFGVIPGNDKPNPDLGGQTGTELVASVGAALALAMLGLTVLPAVLATYREKGILRRLGATPARPAALLAAQLVVNAVAAIAAVALVIVVGALVVGLPVPQQPVGFAATFVLGLAALFSIGLLVAALASGYRTANATGMALFFPSLFLAGVYVPRELLPTALQHISDFTPLGAALQSFRDSWHGDMPRPLHLVTMAGYAVVAGVAAARYFRWE
jgi:ABC-2 type transport system permease protein